MPVEAKAVSVLAEQVWDTFPAFCTLPTDVAAVYPAMARKLGAIRDPEHRRDHCRSPL